MRLAQTDPAPGALPTPWQHLGRSPTLTRGPDEHAAAMETARMTPAKRTRHGFSSGHSDGTIIPRIGGSTSDMSGSGTISGGTRGVALASIHPRCAQSCRSMYHACGPISGPLSPNAEHASRKMRHVHRQFRRDETHPAVGASSSMPSRM